MKQSDELHQKNGFRQKKAILINDLSGLGRCSLSVELPVLSVMQVECLLVPTTILSSHTEYEHYTFRDLSDDLDAYMETWVQNGVSADAIVSGFLASAGQVDHVLRCIDLFRNEKTLVIVDPVLGDNGGPYPTVDRDLQKAMRRLCRQADIILPNLTELCLLSQTAWKPSFSREEIESMARFLQQQGTGCIVVSGIEIEDRLCECILEADGEITWLSARKRAGLRAGTGDLFCAVITGSLLQGLSLKEAVKRAGDFVRLALQETERLHVPQREGTAFEMVLCHLCSCPSLC